MFSNFVIFLHKGFEVRINVWWRMICLDVSRDSILVLVFVQQIKHFTSCSFSFLPFATWQDAFFLSDSFVLALRLISWRYQQLSALCPSRVMAVTFSTNEHTTLFLQSFSLLIWNLSVHSFFLLDLLLSTMLKTYEECSQKYMSWWWWWWWRWRWRWWWWRATPILLTGLFPSKSTY